MSNKEISFLVIAFIFAGVILNAGVAVAVPAAPSPVCEINAQVVSVKKLSDYYRIYLDIADIKEFGGDGVVLCDDSYAQAVESSGAGLLFKEYDLNKISEGQKIKANIHFGGDEYSSFHYTLSNIQITDNSPVKVEEKVEVKKGFWRNLKCFFINLFGGDCR